MEAQRGTGKKPEGSFETKTMPKLLTPERPNSPIGHLDLSQTCSSPPLDSVSVPDLEGFARDVSFYGIVIVGY